MLGPVLAGSGVHDYHDMMNLHLYAVTTFMTGVCEVNASVCDTVVHGPSSSSAKAISHDPSLQPYSLPMLSIVSFHSIKKLRIGFPLWNKQWRFITQSRDASAILPSLANVIQHVTRSLIG